MIWFFSSKNKEEFQNIAKTNEYLDEAYNTLLNLSADEKKRLEYEAREKALKDYNTQISSAEKRGLKAGEEIGRKAGEEIGRKAGEEIGIRKGKELGVEEARQVFKLYMQGKSPEEIAVLCQYWQSEANIKVASIIFERKYSRNRKTFDQLRITLRIP